MRTNNKIKNQEKSVYQEFSEELDKEYVLELFEKLKENLQSLTNITNDSNLSIIENAEIERILEFKPMLIEANNNLEQTIKKIMTTVHEELKDELDN